MVNFVPSEKFDKFDRENTQGVFSEVYTTDYVELEDLINMVKNKKNRLLVLLNSKEYPHNVGAIIRNAVCCCAD